MHNLFTQPEAQEVYDFIVSHEVLSFDLQNRLNAILKDEYDDRETLHDYFLHWVDEAVKHWIVRHSEEGVKL